MALDTGVGAGDGISPPPSCPILHRFLEEKLLNVLKFLKTLNILLVNNVYSFSQICCFRVVHGPTTVANNERVKQKAKCLAFLITVNL